MVPTNLITDDRPLPKGNRLIVLVPNVPIDHLTLGRRIWDLASIHRSSVAYLSVVQDLGQELQALRKVSALASVTRDVFTSVEPHVQLNTTWQKALRQMIRPGDIIVCIDCHMVRVNLFWRKPIGSLLAGEFKVPVYVLSNSPRARPPLGKLQGASVH